MSKRYIVTGHKGFIGSHYFNSISNAKGYDIQSGHNLCSASVVEHMPDCDILVHMAATNGTRLFYETPTEVSFNNTLPTFNLVKNFNYQAVYIEGDRRKFQDLLLTKLKYPSSERKGGCTL